MNAGRRANIDIARGVALIGIVANHAFYHTNIELVTILQDFPALLFVFLSGVSARLTMPSTRKILVRMVFFVALGAILSLGSGQIAVILVNFALIISVTPLLHKAKNTLLSPVGGVWIALGMIGSTIILRVLRELVAGAPLGFTVLALPDNPLAVLLSPLLGTLYPALVWVWVYAYGYWVENNSGAVPRKGELFDVVILGILFALFIKLNGYIFGFPPDLSLSHPMNTPWFSPAPYSSGFADIASGVAICLVAYALATAYEPVLRPVATLGRNTLTLYCTHVAIHAFVGTITNITPLVSCAYFIVTLAILYGTNECVSKRGHKTAPLERLIAQVAFVSEKER